MAVEPIKVLFVCLGNIHRSPAAEGVFRSMIAKKKLNDYFEADSSGTGDWHIGSHPAEEMQVAARLRGYDLSKLKARKVTANDLGYFDYVLAMDRQNKADLLRIATDQNAYKIQLLLDYADEVDDKNVPDPYYGDETTIEEVLDLLEVSIDKFLSSVLSQER